MLSVEHERAVTTQATTKGLSEQAVRTATSVWLTQNRMMREAELADQARSHLRAGLYPDSKWVKRAAVQTAIRLFMPVGVAEGRAAQLVADLLKAEGFGDERDAEAKWAPMVDSYRGRHCRGGTYRKKQLAEMTATVESFGFNQTDAERIVTRYLGHVGLKLKPGLFG